MWYVVNGAVQLETDVVTGLPTPERETPTGVYSILEMKRDKTLVGEINPSTGQPSYRTKVGYWMRVTWTGIDSTMRHGIQALEEAVIRRMVLMDVSICH